MEEGKLSLRTPQGGAAVAKKGTLTRECMDGSNETIHANAEVVLEGTIRTTVPYHCAALKATLTVVEKDAFGPTGTSGTTRFGSQRVILGAVKPTDSGYVAEDGVLPAVLTIPANQSFECDDDSDDDKELDVHKAAGLDVHAGLAFELKAYSDAVAEGLNTYATDDDDLFNRVDEDTDPSLFSAEAPVLEFRPGDLRLFIRYEQRGGHGDSGMGVALLCRRRDPIAPPLMLDPRPVKGPADVEKRLKVHRSNTFNDCF